MQWTCDWCGEPAACIVVLWFPIAPTGPLCKRCALNQVYPRIQLNNVDLFVNMYDVDADGRLMVENVEREGGV